MKEKQPTIKISKRSDYVVCGHINIKAVEVKAGETEAEAFGIYCKVCNRTYWFDVVK